MTWIHEIKCDKCGKKAKLKYNGEHYLPPIGWVRLYDDNKAEVLDDSLCPDCRPKIRKRKEVES